LKILVPASARDCAGHEGLQLAAESGSHQRARTLVILMEEGVVAVVDDRPAGAESELLE
jgi:hypothetical protein